MIVFRLIQGVGAGAVQPVAMTIVGDLYSVQERGKIQGWLASVWALSAVIGPLVGALIIQHWSWSWIFWINLPVGVLASAGFWAYLHEGEAPKRGKNRSSQRWRVRDRDRRDHGGPDGAIDVELD